jgi:outer membrane immunogenic protein
MSTRRLLTAVIAGLLAGVAHAANAADLEVRPSVAAYSWSGCYVGGNFGFGILQDGYTGAVNPAVVNPAVGIPTTNVQSQWGFGGVLGNQIGCNYQIGRLVVGIEAEAWWSTLKTQSNLTTFGDAQKATTKNPWGADLTTRIGFTFDEFLFYTKAGVAWGSFKYEFTSFGAAQSGSAFSIGLLWGFGLEYAFMPDWTLRAETNVIYFSNSDVNISCIGCAGVGAFKASISSYEILFKLGANYKLN